MSSNTNKIYIQDTWGVFLGLFDHNQLHRHYSIQLSLPLKSLLEINTEHETYQSQDEGIIVPSNIKHSLVCQEAHLLFLINPISQIGHYFQLQAQQTIYLFNDPIVSKIRVLANQLLNHTIAENQFVQHIETCFNDFRCSCEEENHLNDDRMIKAINYIVSESPRIVPVQEMADYCFLSPSRFLHVFREKTGITYRRAQLWVKLTQSLPTLGIKNITQTAHEYGFTDSAHYSKTFKENFGFSPRHILKVSQFIQV